jgi:hypothetical protein
MSHDMDAARSWIAAQDSDIFVLSESDLAATNPNKFQKGFYDPDYRTNMVEAMRIKVLTWKARRDLAVVMDMRHQTAVDSIAHDHSILFYDGSRSRRLDYNPTYTTDFAVISGSEVLQDLLQKAG